MSFYYRDGTVKKYLNRRDMSSNQNVRSLNPAEFTILLDMRNTDKEMRILVCEILTMISVLKRIKNADLNYIVNNMYRVVSSLKKQRKLIWAVRCAYVTCLPDDEELAGIKRFISEIKTRIGYVRKTVVVENLNLTPIAEYLEIANVKEMRDDLISWFKSRKAMVQASVSEDLSEMDEYVEHILKTVRDAGRLTDYNDRLKKYAKQAAEREQRVVREKEEEKRRKIDAEQASGMLNFQRIFNHAVVSLSGDYRIKLTEYALCDTIARYGRNCFFVLCCYYFAGRIIYRYVGKNEELTPFFYAAHVFKKEETATGVMERMKKKCPDKLFDVIKLDTIED